MKGSRMTRYVLTASLAIAWLGMLAPVSLQAQDADQAVGEHLRAGEFAPALAVARQQPGPARDRLLGQIAQAQAGAGMRRAAYNTVGGISNSQTFHQTVDRLGGRAVGDGFGGQGFGAQGGGPQPEFEPLMEMIERTIAPDSWQDAGGPGSIEKFEGGVRVDTAGLVHSLLREDKTGDLASVRRRAGEVGQNADVRRKSLLRKVSLTRLERAVRLKLAAGEPLDEDMMLLAGLTKIQYVMVYPETGDIVLAGPAGDWRTDEEGRVVGVDSDRPVLRLDDLVVILRHMTENVGKPFGCSITPLKENLARTKAYLDSWAKKRIPAGRLAKDKWLADLRDNLGQQAVEFYGVDPRTRVARVMFEADYRMKLVGIGKERASHKVLSYLAMIKPDEAPATLGVMRWWFTLNYDAILASKNRDAFELRGQGVKVLSENELLDAAGNRIHTGKSDPRAAAFARSFTKHFNELAAKYPIYAELRNVFDLALVCSLIQSEDLPGQTAWRMACFGDPEAYHVSLGHAPARVESVINHKNLARGRFVVAVSGGVRVDVASQTQSTALETDESGTLTSRHDLASPRKLPMTQWWWD